MGATSPPMESAIEPRMESFTEERAERCPVNSPLSFQEDCHNVGGGAATVLVPAPPKDTIRFDMDASEVHARALLPVPVPAPVPVVERPRGAMVSRSSDDLLTLGPAL